LAKILPLFETVSVARVLVTALVAVVLPTVPRFTSVYEATGKGKLAIEVPEAIVLLVGILCLPKVCRSGRTLAGGHTMHRWT
jgi:hypothetical protein